MAAQLHVFLEEVAGDDTQAGTGLMFYFVLDLLVIHSLMVAGTLAKPREGKGNLHI